MILDEITAFLKNIHAGLILCEILRDLAHARNGVGSCSRRTISNWRSVRLTGVAPAQRRPLNSGAPEDFVLQGHFASAFASEGVSFDDESGSFTPRRLFHTAIGLSGDRATVTLDTPRTGAEGIPGDRIPRPEASAAGRVVRNNLWSCLAMGGCSGKGLSRSYWLRSPIQESPIATSLGYGVSRLGARRCPSSVCVSPLLSSIGPLPAFGLRRKRGRLESFESSILR